MQLRRRRKRRMRSRGFCLHHLAGPQASMPMPLESAYSGLHHVKRNAHVALGL